MKYFYEIYGCYRRANWYLSSDPLDQPSDNKYSYYIAIDQICEINGNRITMSNGDYYLVDDIDSLMKFMYQHDCHFMNRFGEKHWAMPMT